MDVLALVLVMYKELNGRKCGGVEQEYTSLG
jgi:hypothetical protein